MEHAVRQREDGRFEARYLAGRDKQGRKRYASCYGATKEEAIEKRNAIRKAAIASAESCDITMDVLYRQWGGSLASGLSAASKRKYAACAELTLLPLLKDTLISSLTEDMVSRVFAQLRENRCSWNRICDAYALLHKLCDFACEKNYLPVSPMERLSRQDLLGEKREENERTGGKDMNIPDSQLNKLESLLIENLTPAHVALYLILNAGLRASEAEVLRFSDIDFENRRVIVRGENGVVERNIPLAEDAYRILCSAKKLYMHMDDYIASAGIQKAAGKAALSSVLRRLNKMYCIAPALNTRVLRDAYIRRLLQCELDALTVCRIAGLSVGELQKRYGQYIKDDGDKISRIQKFKTAVGIDAVQKAQPRMNLLILGAGDHGHAVMETAAAKKIFEKISFLDDNTEIEEAIGTCINFEYFRDEYPMAFPAFGNNELRKHWIEKLTAAGFIIPTLVHPEAYIAPSARIGEAVIIEAKATVSTNVQIAKGCIISSNAIVDMSAVVNEYSFVGCGATVGRQSYVPDGAVVGKYNWTDK